MIWNTVFWKENEMILKKKRLGINYMIEYLYVCHGQTWKIRKEYRAKPKKKHAKLETNITENGGKWFIIINRD